MPDGDTRRLQVACTDERGRPIRAGLARWLERVVPARVRGAVAVAIVSDARVRALNRIYRRKDYPTDVLSFPATDDWSARRPDKPGRPRDRFLGDIVIARGVAAAQARDAGHSTSTELHILALHGLLHLIGYDHERDAGEMQRVEARLLARGGLREALIERAQRVRVQGRRERSTRRNASGDGRRERSTPRSASDAGGTPRARPVLDTRERSTPRSASGAGVGPRAVKK